MSKLVYSLIIPALFTFSLALASDVALNDYAQVLIGSTSKDSLRTQWNQKSGHHLTLQERQQVEAFSRDHLSAANKFSETVLYPFGGPDAIYPHLFFPNMKKLILVGSENVGVLPNLDHKEQYSTLKNIMGTLFVHTFYHTKKMKADKV